METAGQEDGARHASLLDLGRAGHIVEQRLAALNLPGLCAVGLRAFELVTSDAAVTSDLGAVESKNTCRQGGTYRDRHGFDSPPPFAGLVETPRSRHHTTCVVPNQNRASCNCHAETRGMTRFAVTYQST